jgi:hypothetical protein
VESQQFCIVVLESCVNVLINLLRVQILRKITDGIRSKLGRILSTKNTSTAFSSSLGLSSSWNLCDQSLHVLDLSSVVQLYGDARKAVSSFQRSRNSFLEETYSLHFGIDSNLCKRNATCGYEVKLSDEVEVTASSRPP